MKLPKIRQRDPITGRPTGITLRPLRLAIGPDGERLEIHNATIDATGDRRQLAPGWRWATGEEAAAFHRERIGGGTSEWNPVEDPQAVKRQRAGERLDANGRRIPKSPEARARDRRTENARPGAVKRRGVTW